MKAPAPDAPVWIYGANSVHAVLKSRPRDVVEVCFAERKDNPRLKRLREEAEAAGVTCTTKPARAIERLTDDRNHQGVAALCRLPVCLGERDLAALCTGTPAFLILDRVTDPANLGACLRSAEACGATAVIAPSSNAAALTPATVKVASGAAGRVPFVRVANLARAVGLLKERGVWIVGAAADAGRRLCEINCRRPTAFVMGAEGAGLRRRTAALCDHLAAIPMCGQAESLNVSAAAAICLYEMRRQRDADDR